MTKQIQAELLILGLILLGSTRFLFVRQTRKDSLAVLSLVGFIISIFNIFIFGFSSREIIIMFFALWTTIWNFRSILRLLSDVVVDHFDIRLIVISIINSIACCFLIFFVFKFMPAPSSAEKMEVNESVQTCSGNFASGFSEIKEPFKFTSAKIWNFERRVQQNAGITGTEQETQSAQRPQRTIVLFVPPKTAGVEIYRLFLQKLAKNGYSVYAGEFWTKDAKWFNKISDMAFLRRWTFDWTKKHDSEKYESVLKANKNELVQEWKELIKEAAPDKNEMVFLLTEDDIAESMKAARELNPEVINGTFDLTYLEDNPSKGYGPVENTDPFFALGLGIEADRSGYISSHLAMEVTDFISRQIVTPEE